MKKSIFTQICINLSKLLCILILNCLGNSELNAQCNTCSTTNTISTVNGNTNSSAITGGSFNGGTVCIINNFTVNTTSFSFINCDVKISPTVIITVLPGCTLNINKAHLHACDVTMWHGIELGGIVITATLPAVLNVSNQSVIEDAINAVNVGADGVYHISGQSYFNKNWVSINKNSTINNLLSSCTIDETYFTCRTQYNNPSTNANCLLIPYSGSRSSRFIFIQNTSHQSYPNINVAPYTHINYFDNADIAIDCFWCYATIIKNNVKNCTTGLHFTFDGSLLAKQNNITFCNTGILVDYNGITSANITDNNLFDNLGTGIAVLNSPHLTTFTVTNNIFSNCANFGIRCNTFFVALSGYSPIATIKQNNFTSSINARAIELTEANLIANAKYYVDENNITNFASGINTVNLKKSTYDNNTITLSVPTLSLTNNDAIHFASCPAAEAKHNILTGNFNNACNITGRGIVNESNNGAVIGCNNVDLIGRHFCFLGTTTGNTFVENIMHRGHDQVYLFNNPGLGYMGYGNSYCGGQNSWLGPDCTGGNNTFADINSNPTTTSTVFYVHPGGQPIINQFSFPSKSCSWIATGWTIVNGICSSGSSPLDRPMAYYDGAMDIAQDSILSDPNEADLQWLAKYYLLGEFGSDTVYLDSNLIMKQAIDSLRGTNIGLIEATITALTNDSSEILIGSMINNLIPLNQAEQNYKDILPIELKIRNYGFDTLSSNEIDLIRNIADQCPDGGGNAVYTARVLLSLIDGTDPYREYCSSYPNRYGALNFQETNTSLNIKPNPTKDYFELNTTESGTLHIYNYLGIKVASIKVVNGNSLFEIKNLGLGKGVFLLHFQSATGMQTCKLIIE